MENKESISIFSEGHVVLVPWTTPLSYLHFCVA